jgi:hypothetical protein
MPKSARCWPIAWKTVGIPSGDYVVKVNNRKVLNGVMEVAGLAGDDKEAERGIVLRAIDKIDRLGPEGVRALLGEGRKDESGDFTKGAGLNAGTGRGRDGLHQRQARHGGRDGCPVARTGRGVRSSARRGGGAGRHRGRCSPRRATVPTVSS